MEIVGGFMVMMSIIGLFLAVVWLVMPFVVFAIKGKQDRTLEVLEGIERRLAALETVLQQTVPGRSRSDSSERNGTAAELSDTASIENAVIVPEASGDKDGSEV